jgi:predicted amidohydrolase YtcJ
VSTLVLREAQVEGAIVDLRVEDAQVEAIGPPGTVRGADVEIDCGGGALLPGLHDHHLHLLSMAAAAASVDVSTDLDQRIRAAHLLIAPGQPIRAVNYDEVGEGHLDRWRLDALAPGRAVRVQHRSGALWVLSSAALHEIGAAGSTEVDVERDAAGRPTGRLFRSDDWLHDRLAHDAPADLGPVGRRLAAFGITGVTDCTPVQAEDYFDTLARAVQTRALPLTVFVTGGPELSAADPPPPLCRGPVKILISDHALPAFDDLMTSFQRARQAGRSVAVHCVTRAALFLALAVWSEVGSVPGDRVEHASVTPPEAIATLAQLDLTVVTQPACGRRWNAAPPAAFRWGRMHRSGPSPRWRSSSGRWNIRGDRSAGSGPECRLTSACSMCRSTRPSFNPRVTGLPSPLRGASVRTWPDSGQGVATTAHALGWKTNRVLAD